VPTVTSQIKIVGTFRFARPAVWLSERSSVETIFETVIASAAKQSIDQRKERVDCFVAYAPRNDDKIHVRVLATRCVRSFREIFAPRSEGVRDAGCPVHPQPRARILVVSMRTSIHSGRTEIIRQSRTQWFTAYNELSPVIGFLATVAGEKDFRQLDASTEASGPHVFAVRIGIARLARRCVHRIPIPRP
jgi:hypothetical protein